jgi:hypothetical protein
MLGFDYVESDQLIALPPETPLAEASAPEGQVGEVAAPASVVGNIEAPSTGTCQ